MPTALDRAIARDARDNVARGVKLLDKKGPPDWRSRVKPDELYIKSAHRCVLGQIYGSWSTGCNRLGIPDIESGRYGFNAGNRTAPVLEATWSLALENRPAKKSWLGRLKYVLYAPRAI